MKTTQITLEAVRDLCDRVGAAAIAHALSVYVLRTLPDYNAASEISDAIRREALRLERLMK